MSRHAVRARRLELERVVAIGRNHGRDEAEPVELAMFGEQLMILMMVMHLRRLVLGTMRGKLANVAHVLIQSRVGCHSKHAIRVT